jgi:hypothetical protein
MTPAEISQYGGIVLALIAIAGHVKTWMSSGEKRLTEKVAALDGDAVAAEKKLTEHDRRIQSLEDEIKHLPNKDAVHHLQIDLTELKGFVATLAESSKATASATKRVEEFLLNRPN